MIAAQGSPSDRSRPLSSLPREVREVEHAWIPLADGTRLACRYWLPADAEERPVPAILEYIPYCKRDGTSARDEAMHPYLAGHGYCAIRVDLRGSGESDGVLLGEYLAREQDDAVEAIAWIAAQPWCTGAVGMFGKSWGGFNSLQVAARRPPALKAIITVYSTDDRYADDIHTMGGCQLLENPNWAFTMFGHNARPPDPRLAGADWRATWMRRLENDSPWILEWLRHQRRDAFWKHGSVCEDYARIACPVFAVGGWADPYTNPVLRLMRASRRAAEGPDRAVGAPVPASGASRTDGRIPAGELRWWDHWLKDEDTGVAGEPMIRAWMHDAGPPAAVHDRVPGGWVAEEVWPSARIRERTWHLNGSGLGDTPGPEQAFAVASPATVGRTNPFWGNSGAAGDPECPLDQRADDAVSLCFDSAPLTEPLAFLGTPVVVLRVASDRPVAQVRRAPLGGAGRRNGGARQLRAPQPHSRRGPRAGDSRSCPANRSPPACRSTTTPIASAAGSRIRIAVATGLWPLAWPAPEPVTLTVTVGRSTLTLPVRPRPGGRRGASHAAARRVHPRSPRAPRCGRRLPQWPASKRTSRPAGSRSCTSRTAAKTRIDADGWTYGNVIGRRFEIHPDDPCSASADLAGDEVYGREGEIDIRIRTWMRMTLDESCFHLHARLEADEDGRCVFSRTWLEAIPRDGV